MSLMFHWEDFIPLQIIGFVVLTFGAFTFGEAVSLKACFPSLYPPPAPQSEAEQPLLNRCARDSLPRDSLPHDSLPLHAPHHRPINTKLQCKRALLPCHLPRLHEPQSRHGFNVGFLGLALLFIVPTVNNIVMWSIVGV